MTLGYCRVLLVPAWSPAKEAAYKKGAAAMTEDPPAYGAADPKPDADPFSTTAMPLSTAFAALQMMGEDLPGGLLERVSIERRVMSCNTRTPDGSWIVERSGYVTWTVRIHYRPTGPRPESAGNTPPGYRPPDTFQAPQLRQAVAQALEAIGRVVEEEARDRAGRKARSIEGEPKADTPEGSQPA